MVRKILQRLSNIFQSASGSYKRHNTQYEAEGQIDIERREGLKKIQNDVIDGPHMRVRHILRQHSTIRTAIDVGSGTGWSAAALSSIVDSVIGIEPSAKAIMLAQAIYPAHTYPNITWVHGFAEDVLPTLSYTAPVLFLTGCVLSHLRDTEVARICSTINAAAPVGSLIIFDECWGDVPWHQLMWHVRTKEWWRTQFPEWRLEFHGPVVLEHDSYKGSYHKGFWGIKS